MENKAHSENQQTARRPNGTSFPEERKAQFILPKELVKEKRAPSDTKWLGGFRIILPSGIWGGGKGFLIIAKNIYWKAPS